MRSETAGSLLITGAGGFIGSAMVAATEGFEHTTACSRREVLQAGVDWVPLDELLRSKRSPTFDAVVHLAGNADHGLAAREPWADLEATAGLAARILTRLRARKLVILSSAAVYAGHEGLVDPTVPCQPPMAYALSKLYVEGLGAALVQDGHFGSLMIVRLYNAFGPGERPSRLIPRIVAAARAGTPFTLTADPGSLSDPIHVRDVVRVLRVAAASPVDGIFDLCGGEPRTIVEQVDRVCSALGLAPPPVEIHPSPDQVPIRFWSDPRRLADALGLRSLPDFAMSVIDYGRVVGWVTR